MSDVKPSANSKHRHMFVERTVDHPVVKYTPYGRHQQPPNMKSPHPEFSEWKSRSDESLRRILERLPSGSVTYRNDGGQ